MLTLASAYVFIQCTSARTHREEEREERKEREREGGMRERRKEDYANSLTLRRHLL